MKSKNKEAMTNRKNEMENGPTRSLTIFPAVKVPPQNSAVNNNLVYISH
jgi:hypothetical protein